MGRHARNCAIALFLRQTSSLPDRVMGPYLSKSLIVSTAPDGAPSQSRTQCEQIYLPQVLLFLLYELKARSTAVYCSWSEALRGPARLRFRYRRSYLVSMPGALVTYCLPTRICLSLPCALFSFQKNRTRQDARDAGLFRFTCGSFRLPLLATVL